MNKNEKTIMGNFFNTMIKKFKKEEELATWLEEQKSRYKNGSLSKDEIDMLEEYNIPYKN